MMMAAGILAAGGLYLIGEFLWWEATGRKAWARIDDFRPGRLIRLPVVTYIDPSGKQVTATAARVDQLLYLIGRPRAGNVAPVICARDKLHVYGYARLLAALALILPLIAAIGMDAGKSEIIAQVLYIVIFAGVFIGGFAILRFIYRH